MGEVDQDYKFGSPKGYLSDREKLKLAILSAKREVEKRRGLEKQTQSERAAQRIQDSLKRRRQS